MESYIPLVKAIIISTMFSWGTTSVMITDQYIYREKTFENPATRTETKDYKVLDVKRGVVHIIDQEMKYRITIPFDTLHKFESFSGIGKKVYKITSMTKETFGSYKCTKETKEFQRIMFIDGRDVVTKYEDISYFAKIPWLDKALDTKEKRQFTAFDGEQYSPYHYLLYEFYQFENYDPQDQVLRIIEKKEVDTTFIHTLLSLPLKAN